MIKNRKGFTEQPAPKTFEGMSQYRPALCFELPGKTLELVMDTGFDYELTFKDRKVLTCGEKGKEAAEYEYDCLKVDDDKVCLAVFHFLLDDIGLLPLLIAPL